MVTLKINNRSVEVPEGATILQAAKKLGIFIPTFCHDDNERLPERLCDGCEEETKCWICSCQVEGKDYLMPACSTPVENGMKVWTESPTVRRIKAPPPHSFISLIKRRVRCSGILIHVL